MPIHRSDSSDNLPPDDVAKPKGTDDWDADEWNAPNDGEDTEDDFDDLDPNPDDPIPGDDIGLDFDDEEPEPGPGDFWPESDDDDS